MRFRLTFPILASLLALGGPSVALAGMPTPGLTDLAQIRVEAISFFTVVLLVLALIVQWLWNSLAGDFSKLPRLSYSRAIVVVLLWGLGFTLVLTMIAGTRELMTPGAWEKNGLTYRLAGEMDERDSADDNLELLDIRRQGLLELKTVLWDYALAHDGRFTPTRDDPEVAGDHWRFADLTGMDYLYIPGLSAGAEKSVLAYEPNVFGDTRLVLQADGRIATMTSGEIRDELGPEE